MDDLSGFQRDLLYVLAGAERPSGQDVKAALEPYYGAEINASRLYSNLDRLAGKGLVEKGRLNQRQNYYAITETGLARLRAHREWVTQQLES